MLAATLLAIFLIPMLFVVIERLTSKGPSRSEASVASEPDPSAS
jgi:predicted Kef-type K+ transport protein